MFSWKGLALFLTVFCVLAAIVGSTQARYPERFPDTAGGILNPAQNQSLDDDVSFCHGDDTDWCCEWDTDGTEGLLCTAADCDGLGGSCTAAHVYEDSGNLIADLKGIDSITNSSQKITVGPPGASSHSFGANQLHVTCAAEFDNDSYFDAPVTLGTTSAINGIMTVSSQIRLYDGVALSMGTGQDSHFYYNTSQTNYSTMLTVPASSMGLIIIPTGDQGTNYNHVVPNDPTIWCHSADETDITQFYSLSWNRLTLGGDGGGLGCINQTFSYTDFTDDGGASGHLDLDEQIPIGAVVQQMILHSLTGFTGDTTAVLTAGDDGGVDVDRYHSAGTLNVVASSAAGVDCGAPSGTTFHVAAVTVRLVLTGAADFGNFSAGEATISICYWTP